VSSGKPVLAFLLDPDMPWSLNRVDALGSQAGGGTDIARFRTKLGSAYLSGVFRTPEDLASQVAAAVAAQGLTRHMVDRVLAHSSVSATDMASFGAGIILVDTTVISIKSMVAGAGTTRAIVVDLGHGDQWWSTRLYLLASLLRSLTGVRQLVFRHPDGRFAGMASPSALADGLAAAFPLLDEFSRELRSGESSVDTERETDRQVSVWNQLIRTKLAGDERQVKVGVRAQLLERWLGERLVTRCIRVDGSGLTMTQVQQIVDSLLPDVPVERWQGVGQTARAEVQVVDRDAFALELAREWVRTGLPRTPVR
jgi:hypothetical protein